MQSDCSTTVHLTVFSSMFSLINPKSSSNNPPTSLSLPPITNLFDEIPEEASTLTHIPVLKIKKRRKKTQRITACQHINKKHYARGMCNSCYHRYGRDTYAWLCEHTDRKLYAKGMCELCYNKQHAETTTKIKIILN
ncbi:unnamed protein product [Blepharisma stoltei]|uniref:Uncharacterized protein n=1 Tax=Blepharisma stoltei TaxID=1481888 RepID=A0AAU9JVG2_9CILI|nr:unnamed protein product [Blepharisma stoltei]